MEDIKSDHLTVGQLKDRLSELDDDTEFSILMSDGRAVFHPQYVGLYLLEDGQIELDLQLPCELVIERRD